MLRRVTARLLPALLLLAACGGGTDAAPPVAADAGREGGAIADATPPADAGADIGAVDDAGEAADAGTGICCRTAQNLFPCDPAAPWVCGNMAPTHPPFTCAMPSTCRLGNDCVDAFGAGTVVSCDAAVDAGPPQSCAQLHQACGTDQDCCCALGKGCDWDNVGCVMGACAPLWIPDASGGGGWEQCCGDCQIAYDRCDAGDCLSTWLACNATCAADAGGTCPVR